MKTHVIIPIKDLNNVLDLLHAYGEEIYYQINETPWPHGDEGMALWLEDQEEVDETIADLIFLRDEAPDPLLEEKLLLDRVKSFLWIEGYEDDPFTYEIEAEIKKLTEKRFP